jgi:hypothetical protein
MKLELKHLAPYLPYALRIKTKHGFDTMVTLNGWLVNGDHEESYSYEDHPNETLEFKPILRPLSDLTDPILNLIFKDTGENGITISRYTKDSSEELTITITYKMMGDVFTDFVINRSDIKHTDYWIVEILLINHYDVFGLIDAGLAIDKNTL